MEKILRFLIEISKLKETPKTGWIVMKVKNPETIDEHIFRVAFSSWLFSLRKNLKTEKMIKMALAHDLGEVYAGDATPFFYWDGLNRNKKEDEKILLKGVRLSRKEKERRAKIKFEREREAFLKLVSILNSDLGKEIFSSWFEYEKQMTPEGRFSKQLDRIETLLQSIEYFGPDEVTAGTSWWEITEEIVEDPLLLKFLKVIQKKFYKKAPDYQKDKELESILEFLLRIGKLKRMPRLYWTLREVKNPETVAGHIFTLAIMAWIFGRKKRSLNLEKLLKMALCHEITAIETGDTTPYDRILKSNKEEKEKILAKMVRLSAKEKKRVFLEDYKTEKKALQKVVRGLKENLKKEILALWKDYRKKETPEGYFLSQLNIAAVLLQGILYKKRDKRFSTSPLWEWAFEGIEDPLILEFTEELKKYEQEN